MNSIANSQHRRVDAFAIYRALIRPGRYFRETAVDQINRNFMSGVAPVLIGGALLIFLAALWNAEAIRDTGRALLERRSLRSEELPIALEPAAPLGRLLFAVYWAALLLYLTLVRLGLLSFSGAPNRSFVRVLAFSGHAAIGMMLAAVLLGLSNQLFPILPEPGVSYVRVLFAICLFVLGWVLEARVWILGGRELFALSASWGVVVWLGPVLAGAVLVLFAIFALLVLAGGGGL